MQFLDLGLIRFEAALRRQDETVEAIAADGRPETVFLLEHPHVFTIGRAGRAENLLVREDELGNSIQLYRINRGGDITYHGPGQLVGYPHLDLRERGRDVQRYLRDLERSLVETVASLGVKAFVRSGLTGVWTEEGKLASIGVGVRRWVTMHGFALNVNTDLHYFEFINPCGMVQCSVTSLSRLLGQPVQMEEVKVVFRKQFERVFKKCRGARPCAR